MPKRDPDLLLQDMLEAARKIELYIAGLEYSAFHGDEKIVDAVVRIIINSPGQIQHKGS